MAAEAAPRRLHLGVGVSDGARADELIALAERALAVADGPVVALATLDAKVGHPTVQALSTHLDLAVRGYPAAVLETETPRLLNPSDAVFRRIGCHGVAEAAALASAGPTGKLLVGKMKAGSATVAIAVT